VRQLCLIRLDGGHSGRSSPSRGPQTVRIDESAAREAAFALWIAAPGELCAILLAGKSRRGDRPAGDAAWVASLKCLDDNGTPAWYAAVRGNRLGINGAASPLALTRLLPGALLSVDTAFWLVSHVWRPVPGPAPPEVAELVCPVCGDKLSRAPVVQCPGAGCNRWTHLERPEQPEDKEALNCYLFTGGECPDCHSPATLDPIVAPEPHEKLMAAGCQPDP
jgi:hypothetical protein